MNSGYKVLEVIPKFNVSLLDNDLSGTFEIQKDSISVNGYSLKGKELQDFFLMLEPYAPQSLGSLNEPDELADVLDQAIEGWFAPKIAEMKSKYKAVPTGFMFDYLLDGYAHKVDDGKKLAGFLASYPVIGVLSTVYKTVTHAGRCSDGCSVPNKYLPTNKFYLIEQLGASMGGALMTYPIERSQSFWGALEFSPLVYDVSPLYGDNVPALFGYHTNNVDCLNNPAGHAFVHKKDDDANFQSPNYLKFSAGAMLFQPEKLGKFDKFGTCIE